MEIIIALVFFIVLVLITMYIGLQKKDVVEDDNMPVIHTSGIYSVIRQSPRDNIAEAKPAPEALVEFLKGSGRDQAEQERLSAHWSEQLEKNLAIIEKGDEIGVQRFLIQAPAGCAPCAQFHEKRYFITREDIYKHPELIPPYFPGCECTLQAESEWQNAADMEHFQLDDSDKYTLPSWKTLI